MPFFRRRSRFAAAAPLFIAGLAGASAPRMAAHVRITTTVTWEREISAIVRERCVTCHRDGGGTPMSLATYESARPWARAIRHEVLTRRMPIWHAARGFGNFANDPSLSPFEIALVVSWVDGGAPRVLPPKAGTVPPRLPPSVPLMPPPPFAAPEPEATATHRVQCGVEPAPAGRLLGLRPQLPAGGSVRVTALLPDGRREILGWFRDFDPERAPVYWLRQPLDLPSGTRIESQGSTQDCLISLVTSPPAPLEK